jgi:hypothetical protein
MASTITKPGRFIFNRMNDGLQVNGSVFFVFNGSLTLTKDLHLYGSLSTPNFSEVIRRGFSLKEIKKPVPFDVGLQSVYIIGPTSERQRDNFAGGNSLTLAGGDGVYGGLQFSGSRAAILVGYGAGIDISASRSYLLAGGNLHPTRVFDFIDRTVGGRH